MWISFPFFHGQLVGWQTVRDGTVYEVLPINGRPGYEVRENNEWVGETFATVAEAKAWVDSP